MSLDNSKVIFSNNDIKRGTVLPSELTEELAYFLGFHFSDGHLSISKRRSSVDYLIAYSGSLHNDFEWFQQFISPLLFKLFNLKIDPKIGSKNTAIIMFRSKAVLTFLNLVCGLPLNSKNVADVPMLIQKAPTAIQTAFIRGLTDTDFCVTFKARHKLVHYYPVIEHHSANRNLWIWLIKSLKELGFRTYYNWRARERLGKKHNSYYIQINGKSMLYLWINCIGFKSYNHLSKIELWKNTGSVPPYDLLSERELRIKEKRPWPDSNSPITATL